MSNTPLTNELRFILTSPCGDDKKIDMIMEKYGNGSNDELSAVILTLTQLYLSDFFYNKAA